MNVPLFTQEELSCFDFNGSLPKQKNKGRIPFP